MQPRLFAALLIGLVLTGPALAAENRECVGMEERKALIAEGKVLPLAKAIRAAKVRSNEVVMARLCHGPKGYVYLLTLLARDGKVTHATVDANNDKGVSAS